jgi:hypothetical protein
MPLTFSDHDSLTGGALMNLRGFGPRDLGIFPHGTPAYLAFCTDRARHLFGK